jgi:DNA-damage-inducible protein J
MGAVNVTIRVDENTKKEFDEFCASVGMNITTAVHMYMKAVLRTRQLPFTVTDMPTAKKDSKQALKQAFAKAQAESVAKGRDQTSMKEINAVIAKTRRERTS